MTQSYADYRGAFTAFRTALNQNQSIDVGLKNENTDKAIELEQQFIKTWGDEFPNEAALSDASVNKRNSFVIRGLVRHLIENQIPVPIKMIDFIANIEGSRTRREWEA